VISARVNCGLWIDSRRNDLKVFASQTARGAVAPYQLGARAVTSGFSNHLMNKSRGSEVECLDFSFL